MNCKMSRWELNKVGFQERLENFELNSIDWQLYHSDDLKAEALTAIVELNDALRSAVERYADWRDAQKAVREVMNKHCKTGAADTEPDTELCGFLAYHYNCSVSRW